MKRTIIFILCFMFVNQFFISAQKNDSNTKSGKVGITFSSFGENDVFRFQELDGAAGYDGDYFYTVGINYIHALNKWLEVETGIEYAKHNIIITPNLPPDADNSPRKAVFSLMNIPVTLRASFLKYFFVNGGVFFDIDNAIDSPIDNQSGIGVLLGVALTYDFNFGMGAFINPYTKIHSLIPFSEREQHQRIWENGIRIGLTYDLGKLK